jgi:glucose/arabinose dehydrogenase
MKKMSRYLALSIIAFATRVVGQPVTIALEPMLTGLSEPVVVTHAGDERLFIVETAGLIKIVGPDGQLMAQPFLDITDRVNDDSYEQGLLGLTFDPDYASNGWFYVYYTVGTGIGDNRLVRFSVTADPNVADPNSEVPIWSVSAFGQYHKGGDLHFGPDGYLYLSLGDDAEGGDAMNVAQNMSLPFRQDPPPRCARGQSLCGATGQSICRRPGCAAGDLGQRPSQSLALHLR